MSTLYDARRAIVQYIKKSQSTGRTSFPANIGDGSGVVTGVRSNTVVVRRGSSEPFEVFNMAVPNIENLPVMVGYISDASETLEVLGVDAARISDWRNKQYTPEHGRSHTYGDDEGAYNDLVYVHKRVIIPLMALSTDPLSMQLEVYGDTYIYGGTFQTYEGGFTNDFTANIPADPDYARFVTLYLDPATNDLNYIVGDLFSTLINVETSSIPNPPSGTFPICAILLMNGMEYIDESGIFDLRLINGAAGDYSYLTANIEYFSMIGF